MTLESLNIVRDCYWAMPSGNRYIRDETGNLSSDTHGLFASLNTNDSQAIFASDSGNFIYHGRLEHSNLRVDHIKCDLRASCAPVGSAVLYVNDMEIGQIPTDSSITSYSEYFTLNDKQRERVHQGRILNNYDHFAISLGSADTLSFGTMPKPHIWLDAGSGVYEHGGDYTKSVGSGDITVAGTHVGAWRSRGTNTSLYNQIYGSSHKPVWDNSVLNGQPGIRWWGAPSGAVWLENIDPLTTNHDVNGSGTMVVVCIPMSMTTSQCIYQQDTLVGSTIVTHYNRTGFGAAPTAYDSSGDSNRIVWLQNPNTSAPIGKIWSDVKIPSGTPVAYMQRMSRYQMDDFVYSSGDTTSVTTAQHYETIDKPWLGDVESANRAVIGAYKENGINVFADEFDGFICEIMIYDYKLSNSEWNLVSRYIRDKYGIGTNYIEPNIRLINAAIAYSGEYNWNNHQTGLPNVNTGTYAPTEINTPIGTYWDGSVDDINDGLSSDGTYITSNYSQGYSEQWTNGTVMPSGYLSLGFGGVASGIDPLTTVTRAILTLRMALPPSGTGENVYDAFEVNGYNHRYKNQDNIEDSDLAYILSSNRALGEQYGYFLYGKGDTVIAPNFTNYTMDLNFLNPFGTSGDYKSTQYANVDMLANTDFNIIGLPSGTQISGAQLQVDYINDDNLALYTQGSKKLTRREISSSPDIGSAHAYAGGNGGWHHQGWRLYGPTVIEEIVFDNFYTFGEVGLTRTYPETTKAYYYTGDRDTTTYADFIKFPPTSTADDISTELKIPQKREYYRNPVTGWDLTPDDESTQRTTVTPTYYRHMIYHGDSLSGSVLDEADLCQIYFDDRLGLGEDFSLYFSLYRHNGLNSYGRFFHRGLLSADGIDNYEIVGDIGPDFIRFTIKGADGVDNSVQVSINSNTAEPILVWLSCGYEINNTIDTTTIKLSVHQDTQNYFATDWVHDETTFVGRRKQFSASLIRTAIGTLEKITAVEQASRKLYLHRVSPVEFGYANEYIELDYTTSKSTTQVGYELSQDKDKRFLSTRLSNSAYLNNNPSGVRWVVPPGSGVAEWTSYYNLFETWDNDLNIHSVYNPISTAGTNNIVHPSAIYVQLDVAHATDHPSGVDIWIDVGFDSGTSDNWKVGHIEFNSLPSGGHTWASYAPISYESVVDRHVNMDSDPILWSNLENINLGVTTHYHGQDADYNGSVEIRNIKVYFDAFCVAGTGIDVLDMYVNGTATTLNSQLDLYTLGHISVPSDINNGDLDLYIKGAPHTAFPSSIPLFTEGDPVHRYNTNPDNLLLFVEGLDPPIASGNHTLYIGGANYPTNFTMPMYLKCNFNPQWRLPLFIDAGTSSQNTSLNLMLDNHPDKSIANTTLYINGPTGSGDYIPLFITTPSGTEGAFVGRGSMNLYVDRDSEAYATKMQLFLAQNNTIGSINTFIGGTVTVPSSVALYVYGSGTPPNNNISLFTHGF